VAREHRAHSHRQPAVVVLEHHVRRVHRHDGVDILVVPGLVVAIDEGGEVHGAIVRSRHGHDWPNAVEPACTYLYERALAEPDSGEKIVKDEAKEPAAKA
jgi:hypothetical protein